MSPDAPIYLDHNATTPPAPEVLDVFLRASREAWGNPASDHGPGRAARAALTRATAQVASLVGASLDAYDVVFTSGGTEANDLALHGVTAGAGPARRRIVVSAVEHPSVLAVCEALRGTRRWDVDVVPVDADGVLLHDGVVIDGDVALVSVMWANNETGAVYAEPLGHLAARARAAGAVVHSDGAQAVGRIPVDVTACGVDLLTVVGHKLYGPKGIGALVVSKRVNLVPRLLGGGQQGGRRAGTEPVPTIAAFGEACALAGRILAVEGDRQRALVLRLEQALRRGVPGLRVTAHTLPRLPNTLHVRFPPPPQGFPRALGREVLVRAPEVAAGTGSACHAGIDRSSPVLEAMGLPPEDALGAVRLTVGRGTTEVDVDRTAAALIRAWSELDVRV